MKHLTKSEQKEYQKLRIQIFETRPKSWKSLVRFCMPKASFSRGAKDKDFRELERGLGLKLPSDLKALLSESNGITTPFTIWPVFTTAMILEHNLQFRDPDFLADLRMPFDDLLFFGGLEDPVAFPRLKNGNFDQRVFRWDHETDSRENVAMGLRDYLIQFTVQTYRPMMKLDE